MRDDVVVARKAIRGRLFILGCVGIGLFAGCQQRDLSAYIPPPGKYDVRILRDEWGVPHVFGKRDMDVAYGLAFAHCEDDWTNTEDAVLMTRARLASVHGREMAKFDYLVQLFRVREFVEAKYERELSPDVRALVEAYADGINHYAALNRRKMPHVRLPVTGKDLVAGGTFKSPLFYGLHDELAKLFGDERAVPISDKGVVGALMPAADPLTRGLPMGSNTWAVGPRRSADGATRLAINSHMPWEGPVAFYEAHLHSEEGWNMIGGVFPGGPVIFLGHDENKGWCHTINGPDLADIYVLDMNPDNEHQYKLDGEWLDLERGTASITVKLWGPLSWTFERELLWSVHGPVVRQPHGVYAIRFAGYGEVRQLEQWYRMNKARNVDEIIDAMRMHGLVSLNTLCADKDGNMFYVYNGQFPVRADGYDWRQYLPGDVSEAITTGYHPFDHLPQVHNPDSGFLQSCNSSPYQTTVGEGNPRREDFPAKMGIGTSMTNRSLRALELYGGDESITRDEFYAYKFDKKYAARSGVAKFVDRVLEADLPDEPLLKEAVALLRQWDRTTAKDSPAAALAILATEHFAKQKGAGSGGPLDRVRAAAEFLMARHGRLDVPWQDMMRLRRGDLDLGLGGGPDCLRAVDPVLQDDARFVAINGDCYILMVEWDKDGRVRSQSIHQYGAATLDPASPHYADQAPLFVNEQWKPTLLTEADVRAHLKKEYRPGQIPDPWYSP